MTGLRIEVWNKCITNKCPRSGGGGDTNHILVCKGDDMEDIWKEMMIDIEE